jgi:hypothetical protein
MRASWPPAGQPEFERAIRRLLRTAATLGAAGVAAPRYVESVLSAAAMVSRRAGFHPSSIVAFGDARDALKRRFADTPLRQALPARRTDVHRLFEADPSYFGLFAALLFYTLARSSDWSRTGLLGKGVTPADLTRVGKREWQVRYGATKADPTGWSRTVCFLLPRPVHVALRRRLRAVGPSSRPLFADMSAQRLRRWLARRCRDRTVTRRYTAHSFRRGAVRLALVRGAAGRAVTRFTGHKSLEMLTRYAGLQPAEWRRQQRAVSRTLGC